MCVFVSAVPYVVNMNHATGKLDANEQDTYKKQSHLLHLASLVIFLFLESQFPEKLKEEKYDECKI